MVTQHQYGPSALGAMQADPAWQSGQTYVRSRTKSRGVRVNTSKRILTFRDRSTQEEKTLSNVSFQIAFRDGQRSATSWDSSAECSELGGGWTFIQCPMSGKQPHLPELVQVTSPSNASNEPDDAPNAPESKVRSDGASSRHLSALDANLEDEHSRQQHHKTNMGSSQEARERGPNFPVQHASSLTRSCASYSNFDSDERGVSPSSRSSVSSVDSAGTDTAISYFAQNAVGGRAPPGNGMNRPDSPDFSITRDQNKTSYRGQDQPEHGRRTHPQKLMRPLPTENTIQQSPHNAFTGSTLRLPPFLSTGATIPPWTMSLQSSRSISIPDQAEIDQPDNSAEVSRPWLISQNHTYSVNSAGHASTARGDDYQTSLDQGGGKLTAPGKRPRIEDDDNDSDGGSDDEAGSNKNAKKKSKGSNSVEGVIFACPFFRRNALQHLDCLKVRLNRIQDVKQHVRRQHGPPQFYCPVCGRTFTDSDEKDAHIIARNCQGGQGEPSIDSHRISVSQKQELNKPVDRNDTGEERWYTIWSIIFPKTDRPKAPCGPFMQNTLTEMMQIIEMLSRDKTAEWMSEFLERRKLEGEWAGSHDDFRQTQALLVDANSFIRQQIHQMISQALGAKASGGPAGPTEQRRVGRSAASDTSSDATSISSLHSTPYIEQIQIDNLALGTYHGEGVTSSALPPDTTWASNNWPQPAMQQHAPFNYADPLFGFNETNVQDLAANSSSFTNTFGHQFPPHLIMSSDGQEDMAPVVEYRGWPDPPHP